MTAFTKQKEKPAYTELGKIFDIPIEQIIPNPNQPRRYFDTTQLTSLAKSISQEGIFQPLTVRRAEQGFELIAGERRLRAAKIAGFRTVPCIIMRLSDERSAVLALIENIQRADLNCFEQAQAIQSLIEECGLTQEEVAVKLGAAQSTVANKLRLLKLSDVEKERIIRNKLSERHARALLKIDDQSLREQVLQHIIQSNLTVSETEKYIQSLENKQKIKESYKKRSPVLKDVRLFCNTVDKAVKVIRLAGVNAKMKKEEGEGIIKYTILIENNENTEVQN